MAAVAARMNRLFSATSVPMDLQKDEFCNDEIPDRKSFSRVRKLSKRLSATFKSSFSLREQDIDINDNSEEETHSSATLDLKNQEKRSLGRVFSLQHFNDNNAMFRENTMSNNATNINAINSNSVTTQSSIDISNIDARGRLKRILSSPDTGNTRLYSPYGKLEHYTKLEQLGEGSYATVYKGLSRINNIFVALKEIQLQAEEGIPFTAIREASLLKELKHANIVRLHDIIPAKEHLVLVFEYLHTDLCIFLEERPYGVHANNAKLLLFQLLRGLHYIHKKKILHRDIKPQNVLLSNRGDLKLADFGLARAKSVPSRTYTHEIVTLWYRPPDVLLGSTHYTTSLDIWGVGCIFIEMISGFPLFPGVKSPRDQLNKIFKVCGTPHGDQWPVVKGEYAEDSFERYPKLRLSHQAPRIKTIPYSEELAERMLQINPRNRISAEAAMKHIFFADLPKAIHSLPDASSIFTIAGMHMYNDMKNSDGGGKPKSKSFGHFV